MNRPTSNFNDELQFENTFFPTVFFVLTLLQAVNHVIVQGHFAFCIHHHNNQAFGYQLLQTQQIQVDF